MSRHSSHAPLGMLLGLVYMLGGCPPIETYPGDGPFVREPHSLLPPTWDSDADTKDWHYGSGVVAPSGPDQPIQFTHFRHVTELGMQCEYCHDAARKSIHGGVPSTQTCMNCHTYVAKDRPEIKKIQEYWDKKEPIPWSKVHDAADFVHFNHSRHVQGGVECTECHGQIGLQGKQIEQPAVDASGKPVLDEAGKPVMEKVIPPGQVMVRETTLQMGWCLDCHASHPSIDKNYGDKANLRRAELKDCWTCHK
jgi:hypothetical protein